MNMEEYFVLEKSGKIRFQLPRGWKVIKNALPEPERAQKSVYEMVKEALRNPVGTPPLESLVKSSDHVAVIVDAFARPTPKAEILRSLVDYLRIGGVKDEQIEVVFGLGTHRPLSEAEVAKALGRSLFGRIRYVNHNAWADDLVPIGKLK
jgi:nickel-dependent lactate racemase